MDYCTGQWLKPRFTPYLLDLDKNKPLISFSLLNLESLGGFQGKACIILVHPADMTV